MDNRITGKDIQVNGLDKVAAVEGNADGAEVVFTIDERTENTAEGAGEIKSAADGRILEFMDFALTRIVNGGEPNADGEYFGSERCAAFRQ